MKPNILHGIIPPMITPMLNNEKLDLQGVERLVEHLIAGGVHGIFILGTTGEAQQLSANLKRELISAAAACIKGRIPLLVGITDCSVYDSIALAQYAAAHGATAAVAAPPYFYALSKSELVDYYTDMADMSPLPIYLYNMPSHTKTMLEADVVETLSAHPNIIGLKDSSANGVYFCKLLKQFATRPEFGLFVGPEEMMAAMTLMGGHGGVSGGANVYPEIFVKLYNAAAEGNVPKIIELQSKMLEVGINLFGIGKYAAGYIMGIKTALKIKGILTSDAMVHPFTALDENGAEKIKEAVGKLDNLLI
jgi:4-hydroxy-tetrahydrodipicolinate synthase